LLKLPCSHEYWKQLPGIVVYGAKPGAPAVLVMAGQPEPHWLLPMELP
jgi:hypothetical protein